MATCSFTHKPTDIMWTYLAWAELSELQKSVSPSLQATASGMYRQPLHSCNHQPQHPLTANQQRNTRSMYFGKGTSRSSLAPSWSVSFLSTSTMLACKCRHQFRTLSSSKTCKHHHRVGVLTLKQCLVVSLFFSPCIETSETTQDLQFDWQYQSLVGDSTVLPVTCS